MPIRRENWWDKRTKTEKNLVRLCILTVTVSIIAITILFIATIILSTRKSDICVTSGCVTSAAALLTNMDPRVDPCDDFYQFACGNYVKNAKIPQDKTYVNTFTSINDMLQEQLRLALEEPVGEEEEKHFQLTKKYYRACLNKDLIDRNSLEEAKDLLAILGGWPVLDVYYWQETNFDLFATIYNFRKHGLDYNTVIELAVSLDWKNTSKRIIEIDQPTLGLKPEYLKKAFHHKIIKAYYEYMIDIAVIFGADKDYASDQLKESLMFEMQLANLTLAQEERRNISNMYNIMSVRHLEEIFPLIPWLEYINRILPNIPVFSEEEVLVVVPNYVSRVVGLIKSTPKRVQANYLMWRVVQSIIPYLGQEIRNRELQFTHSLNGLEETTSRWKECVEETETKLPILIGALYIRKYFHQDSKKHALELVRYIKDEFKSILKNLDWMDDRTRRSAFEKAEAIVDHVAYPDELLDDVKLERLYAHLEVSEEEYMHSALNISIFQTNLTLSHLREVVNKTNWMEHANAAEVNAYYHPLENSIIFPAGILQGILFNKDRPRYMNFGAIGSVIGHEITHGFDDQGRQFDKNGNLVDWWESRTRAAFLAKADCIVQQYSNFAVSEINVTLNGLKTQGENIADNGGIKEAYLAYRTWMDRNKPEQKLPGLEYSTIQLFWISAAQNWCSKHRAEDVEMQITTDEHSPEKFRVIGPFSNLDYFAQDFQCTKNTNMNPANKCSVW